VWRTRNRDIRTVLQLLYVSTSAYVFMVRGFYLCVISKLLCAWLQTKSSQYAKINGTRNKLYNLDAFINFSFFITYVFRDNTFKYLKCTVTDFKTWIFMSGFCILLLYSSSFTGFYNPRTGFSLLMLEVLRSHTMTRHSR
jgi:hypothetical protein